MAVQAIIMAGGAGTRLRPLTCEYPKPLAPLCGAPIMDYTLRLLAKHGYDRADVTLWYRPWDIRRRFGEGCRGISLSYVVEDEPVGTAGSVLIAARAGNTILVLSGDGLTDVDLDAALAFHRQRRAAATLVLRHVDIPLAYGVVVAEADGRITRFIEKPDWSRVISSLVNTGIYLLEPEAVSLIPADKPFDFGRDLFPLMLEKGLPLYGYTTDAYWCDVGDPQAFLKAQRDLLAGRAGFTVDDPGIRSAGDAVISPDSYVSSSAAIGKGAVIRGSCVLDGAVVGSGAQLDGAIVCSRARAEQGAVMESGSILGAGSSTGEFSVLRGDAHIWPGIRLADDSVTVSAVRRPVGVTLTGGRAECVSPQQAVSLSAVFLETEARKKLVVMHDAAGLSNYHLALGSLIAYGAETVHALGQGTLGMLSYAIRTLRADGGILCRKRELTLLDRNGLLLDTSAGTMIEAAVRRQELPSALSAPQTAVASSPMGTQYTQTLAKTFRCRNGQAVSLRCGDPFLLSLARSAISLAGHTPQSRADIGILLEENKLAFTVNGHDLSPIQQRLLCARALERQDMPLYDDQDDGLYGVPRDGSEGCLRQLQLFQDTLARAMLILQLFSAEPIGDTLEKLPEIHHKSISIPCASEFKGRVLESLLPEAAPRRQGGLSAGRGDARAVIRPDPALPLMHVAVSARDAETAGELCDFYAGRVLQALRGAQKPVPKMFPVSDP